MAYTTLAQGSSVTITITDQFDGLEVINRPQDLATVALTTGSWTYGATPQQHSGRRVYQLTGPGTITITASSGALQYELTDAADNRVADSFSVAETSSIRSFVSGDRIADAASRDITAADNAKSLAPTGALTYTIPAGLSPMPSFTVDCPASGTISIAKSGAATLNGAGTTLTRTRASNPVGFVVLAHTDADAYGVSGS